MDFTAERFQYVLNLVRKNANAAFGGVQGMRFWVYPPTEYLNDPSPLSEPGIYAKLSETVWWVRWFDGVYDQLAFSEFLLFVHQLIDSKKAFEAAARTVDQMQLKDRHRESKHAGGWQQKKDRSKKQRPPREEKIRIKVDSRVEPAKLIEDEMIRALIKATAIEKTTRPYQALN